jgi:uronate dehydrogenase
MKRILITGAAGDVGQRITPLLKAAYPEVILSDLKPPVRLSKNDRFIAADLFRMDQVATAVAGVDGIVHLGGFSVEGPWETILNANIIGCYHLFEAARLAGVKRIVFASSNHAVGYYPRSRRIPVDVTTLPDSRYGVSKAFGEALGAMYAMKHGIGVTCIRIGNVNVAPIDARRLAIWLHPNDLVQLIRIGFDTPNLIFEVFYGASDNKRSWWDNARARELGYKPRHRSEDFAAQALAMQEKLEPDPIGDYYQGGTFCSAECTADFEKMKLFGITNRS